MERTTRSNKTFSAWSVVQSANPSFDLQASLRDAIFGAGNLDEEEEFDPLPAANTFPTNLPAKTSSDTYPAPPMSRMQKLKAASRVRERAKRSDPTRGARPLSKKLAERFPEDGPSVQVVMALEDAPVTRTGFVGLNDVPQTHRTYTLQEAAGPGSHLGFTLQEWNGRSPMLVVDKNNAVLYTPPQVLSSSAQKF